MPLNVWWWFFYAVFVLFGLWWSWKGPPEGRWGWGGSSVILAILLFIIGLKLFGGPIQG
jgi:hypothetical protein